MLAQNNLVNVVHLLAMAQEREENVREFLARLKAQASMCELSIPCTAISCNEKVSYVDKIILQDIREQLLAKTEEMGLDETIKFVEAKEIAGDLQSSLTRPLSLVRE